MKKNLGFMYGIISASTFGLIPMFSIPTLEAGMSVNNVLFYRYLFSTIILSLYLIISKQSIRVKRDELITLAELILLGGTTAFCLMKSFQYIPSGVATTIHFLYPVVVTLLMTIFFKEKFSIWIMFAVGLAISGVATISGLSSGADVNFTGVFYALMAVLTYALYIIGINKSKAGRMNCISMTFYIMVLLTVFFLITSLSEGRFELVQNWSSIKDLTMLAVFSTLLSNFTLILAIKNIGSTTTAIMGCVEPVTAVIMGVLFLGEPLYSHQIVGIILILISVTFVILSDKLTPKIKALATKFAR
ncbi:MAG: DMT family transporter [Bacteroidales bacterium]